MSKRNQHVVPHTAGWAVRCAGSSKATSVYKTQQQAIDAGRSIAKNQKSELLVHGADGKIRARDSHGQDDFPPRG